MWRRSYGESNSSGSASVSRVPSVSGDSHLSTDLSSGWSCSSHSSHSPTTMEWRSAGGCTPDFWGNGYATEGGSGLLQLAFADRQLSEVFAVVRSSNVRSRAVAERLGMKRVGVLAYAGLPHEFVSIELEQWRSSAARLAPTGP